MRILEVGERVSICTGEVDKSNGLAEYEEVIIQKVCPIYQVCQPEKPDHIFDILPSDVKGVKGKE